METEVVKENASFFEKAFREDIERILRLAPDKRAKLGSFIANIEKYSELNEETKWALFSREIEEPLDDVLKYSRPLQFIAAKAVEENVAAESILNDLMEVGIIPSNQLEVFLGLIPLIVTLVSQAVEKVTPNLPLLQIKGISTRCGMISEFDEELSVRKHSPDEYSPKVCRLYPITTLNLSFRDDAQKPIGIQLTRKDLLTVTKWLQLAQVQMDSLTHYAKEHELPVVEEEDE